MSAGYDFDALSIGDFVVFSRRFTAADWASFASVRDVTLLDGRPSVVLTLVKTSR